jgi:hypothetical protein
MDPAEWRHFLTRVGAGRELREPADLSRLAAAERRLGCELPGELRNLCLASNGLLETEFDACLDLWPLDEMVGRNLEDWAYWTDSRVRRCLLAFGDNGCGEPFCMWLRPAPGVFCWYPIEDEARRLADRLPDFFAGWWSGSIST